MAGPAGSQPTFHACPRASAYRASDELCPTATARHAGRQGRAARYRVGPGAQDSGPARNAYSASRTDRTRCRASLHSAPPPRALSTCRRRACQVFAGISPAALHERPARAQRTRCRARTAPIRQLQGPPRAADQQPVKPPRHEGPQRAAANTRRGPTPRGASASTRAARGAHPFGCAPAPQQQPPAARQRKKVRRLENRGLRGQQAKASTRPLPPRQRTHSRRAARVWKPTARVDPAAPARVILRGCPAWRAGGRRPAHEQRVAASGWTYARFRVCGD